MKSGKAPIHMVSAFAARQRLVLANFTTIKHMAHNLLLFLAGLRPIVADRLRYYADPEFAGSFDPA